MPNAGMLFKKQRQRHKHLVKALAYVSRERAEQVSQQPPDDDGRKLQTNRPADRAADDIGTPCAETG